MVRESSDQSIVDSVARLLCHRHGLEILLYMPTMLLIVETSLNRKIVSHQKSLELCLAHIRADSLRLVV